MEGDCGPKVRRSPCLATATPPSWAGLATIRRRGRRGCSPAAAGFGRSKAISSAAAALGGGGDRAWRRGRASTSAVPPSATLPTMGGVGQRARAAACAGPGAAWVFTRSGGVWMQQGNKLVSTGAVGSARQGMSVALSADGNIAIVSGFADDGGVASVFTRSGGHWTQDKKLLGTGAVGKSAPSIALSADGTIVMLGESNDNGGIGAAWVFTRSGGGSDYQEPLTPSTPPPNPPSLTPSTPHIPPPNFE